MEIAQSFPGSFRQSLLLSEGSLAVFFSNGLVGTIFMAALLLLSWGLVGRLFKKRDATAASA